MKKLRVGVVGVGHIGSNHARLYAEIPSAEFTAVYDVEPFRSRTIASKSGAASAKSLDDFIQMVDAASVATPTNTHYDVARALLAKGKHEAEARHWRYEVVSAKSEGLLLYLRKTHFIKPADAVTEWNTGNLDALVTSKEKAAALMGDLKGAALSQSESYEREQHSRGGRYVLITR